MLPIQLVSKFIKILRSAASPSQIAGGFILGFLLGMSPSLLSLLNLFIILLIIILNINLATALFAFALFSAFAYLMDPFFHSLGFALLVDVQSLKSVWTFLYNTPFIPFTRFNNTVVMGSLSISLILLFPLYFLTKRFVVIYREKYEPRVKNWKWVKLLKSSQIYQMYERLKFLGE
ncbi:MAG: TIGR03546 family protein [bacterium]|nr:MAG: TIGR03546 family protein [bacterium]